MASSVSPFFGSVGVFVTVTHQYHLTHHISPHIHSHAPVLSYCLGSGSKVGETNQRSLSLFFKKRLFLKMDFY